MQDIYLIFIWNISRRYSILLFYLKLNLSNTTLGMGLILLYNVQGSEASETIVRNLIGPFSCTQGTCKPKLAYICAESFSKPTNTQFSAETKNQASSFVGNPVPPSGSKLCLLSFFLVNFLNFFVQHIKLLILYDNISCFLKLYIFTWPANSFLSIISFNPKQACRGSIFSFNLN